MTFAGRDQVRTTFAALLTAHMTGSGKLVQAVYRYEKGDFGGASPVLALASGGSDSVPHTARGRRPDHLIDLWSFVLYAEMEADEQGSPQLVLDGLGAPLWDEEDSQDCLDQIETQLRELIDGNPKGGAWQDVSFAGPSEAGVQAVGGVVYRYERFPLRFKVY